MSLQAPKTASHLDHFNLTSQFSFCSTMLRGINLNPKSYRFSNNGLILKEDFSFLLPRAWAEINSFLSLLADRFISKVCIFEGPSYWQRVWFQFSNMFWLTPFLLSPTWPWKTRALQYSDGKCPMDSCGFTIVLTPYSPVSSLWWHHSVFCISYELKIIKICELWSVPSLFFYFRIFYSKMFYKPQTCTYTSTHGV